VLTAESELTALEGAAGATVCCDVEHPAISRPRLKPKQAIDVFADEVLMVMPVLFDGTDFRQTRKVGWSLSLQASSANAHQSSYERYVNPQWVRLLDVLGINVRTPIVSAGSYLLPAASALSISIQTIASTTPAITIGVIRALKSELDLDGPAMLQRHVPELAGDLANRLCLRVGGKISKLCFCSSGSEGVEAVIKFARAHTRRPGVLCASGGFHGRTCGALSLMDNPFWTAEFGPLLPDTLTRSSSETSTS